MTNSALKQVTETTVHLAQINSMNKTKWPMFQVDNRLFFFKKNNKIMLNTFTSNFGHSFLYEALYFVMNTI